MVRVVIQELSSGFLCWVLCWKIDFSVLEGCFSVLAIFVTLAVITSPQPSPQGEGVGPFIPG